MSRIWLDSLYQATVNGLTTTLLIEFPFGFYYGVVVVQMWHDFLFF